MKNHASGKDTSNTAVLQSTRLSDLGPITVNRVGFMLKMKHLGFLGGFYFAPKVCFRGWFNCLCFPFIKL